MLKQFQKCIFTNLGMFLFLDQNFRVEFYRSSADTEGGGQRPRLHLLPLFRHSDLSGLACLLTHGLRAEGGPLAGILGGRAVSLAACQCKAAALPAACLCAAHLARFRACLASFGILASDVLRILSAVVLLRNMSCCQSRTAAGGHHHVEDKDDNCGEELTVGEPALLTALAQCLGVEAKVLEAGLLWDIHSLEQVTKPHITYSLCMSMQHFFLCITLYQRILLFQIKSNNMSPWHDGTVRFCIFDNSLKYTFDNKNKMVR